ncbi:MAG TPA: o-succinylbenzoate synthase [Ilumatobacteraceae bacterium]|nr:o-succinylbenzoate synthase [Ilumatobacteraceae bacterium]
MDVDEVELRVVRLPYRSVFKTSFAAESEKVAVIATVRSGGVEGYGEGVMDPLPAYREESIPGALHLLREALVPMLLRDGCDDPMTLCDSWARWRGNPMAKSTLELAVWDCHARRLGVPLRILLGGERTEIPVGASLGMNPIPETVASVARHVEQGYRRIKLKIEPGWDVGLLSAVRAEFPRIELTVDANSAYTLGDLDVLRKIDQYGLHYIEQPLHWDDLTDHAVLAPQLQTPLCLDETLTSPARVKAALDLGACAVVNVKVGRVGGLAATIRIHDLCVARGVPMWCGGMLETGIGRAHNIHVATMPGFVYPGDTASASRTYARDITEQALETTDGIMPVPSGPGTGVSLDRPFLETVTESVEVLRR